MPFIDDLKERFKVVSVSERSYNILLRGNFHQSEDIALEFSRL